MSIFSKLFGKSVGRRESSSTMPAFTDLVVDTELEELPEELLARREESMARLMEWLGTVATSMRDITEQLRSQGQSLSSFEHSAKLQLETLRQLNVNIEAQSQTSSKIVEHLQGLPRLISLLPDASRSQTEILKRLSQELKEQSGRAQDMLSVFREVSEKLDNLPSDGAEQAQFLDTLAKKMDVAVEQEGKLAHNMETFSEILKSVNEFTREQTNSLEAIEQTTRSAIEHSSRHSERRFKVTAALLATLIGIVLVLGIIAISRL